MLEITAPVFSIISHSPLIPVTSEAGLSALAVTRLLKPGTEGGEPMRAIGFFVATAMTISAAVHAQEIDWKKVDDVLGRSGAVTGDVHRYGFPRSDLHVT